MIRNYLKIAFRNLSRKKGFTLINILGLATGMAVCLLIVLFVQSELRFDNYQQKGNRIFRIALDRKYPGRINSYAIIPQSIGSAVKAEFPEVEEVVRFFDVTGDANKYFFRIGDKNVEEDHVFIADSNFFKIFTGDIIAGNKLTPLDQPNSVVLSSATAVKLFGTAENAIGKTYRMGVNPQFGPEEGTDLFQITAVCKDWPENSHFKFKILISATGFPFAKNENYINFSAYTYLLLHPNAEPQKINNGFKIIVDKYVAGSIEQNFGMSAAQFQKEGNGYRYFLQPLPDIHLDSNLEAEIEANGSRKAVTIFSIVAVFILALACINFINLSTARSTERAREVGLRKTFGSEKSALITQFLLESVMLSICSIVIALILIAVILPMFNQLAGKELTMQYFLDPGRLAILLGFTVVTGIFAGTYPAFVLSSFKPILVLKGRFRSNSHGRWLRNGLVVFQFSISVVLLIATMVVNRQMKYVMGDELGFQKDRILLIKNTGILGDQLGAFKTELESLSGVMKVARASSMPGENGFFGMSFNKEGTPEQVTGRAVVIDNDFAGLLGIELKSGRFFDPAFSTDTFGVVLNEKAVADLGLTNPIGATLQTTEAFLNKPDGSKQNYTVIGVAKDFHYQSLHQKINPLYFINTNRLDFGNTVIGIKVSGDINATLASVENTWKKFVKDRSFSFDFLDQSLARQYQAEQTMQKIFSVFSLLAVFIACIGLLGLAAYATQQRIREISVRKVLGAGTGSIITMLSVDFLKLVVIATCIAIPLAWWMMHSWLQNFEYRTNLTAWIFIAAALLSLLVALCTISFQAVKAALTNPVKALRNE